MATISSHVYKSPARDVWRLIADPIGIPGWSAGRVDPQPDGACAIADAGGTHWPGRIVSVVDGEQLVVELGALPSHADLPAAQFTLRVEAVTDSSTRACVDGPDADPRLELVWRPVLDRLGTMSWHVERGRQPAQAVVVIHGIGEQRPGDTLRGFVQTVAGDDSDLTWNRPDYVSGSYELRSLSLFDDGKRPRTDFFEFYWAHFIRDTTTGDVVGWVWSLMRRLPVSVPRHLRPAWLLLWALVAAAGFTIVSFGAQLGSLRFFSVGTTVVLGLLAAVLNSTLGDAARYLSPRPNNVSHRQAIREAGVELLRKLHESGRYQRIVLVGHSLGSVIAYDLIKHYWPEMNRRHLEGEQVSFPRLAAAENLEADAEPRNLQASVWREMRRNTQPWLITDLVTAGSPLAHAELLMVRRPEEFQSRVRSRELPTAPPQREADGGFSFTDRYRTRCGTFRSFQVLHHAAPFAAVRWTNLYFPAKWGLFGDLVGGPLTTLFGDWIVDVPLRSALPWWKRRTLAAHTHYWRGTESTAAVDWDDELSWADNLRAAEDHLAVLRAAVGLGQRRRLVEEAVKHDPAMFLS